MRKRRGGFERRRSRLDRMRKQARKRWPKRRISWWTRPKPIGPRKRQIDGRIDPKSEAQGIGHRASEKPKPMDHSGNRIQQGSMVSPSGEIMKRATEGRKGSSFPRKQAISRPR